MKSLKSLCHNAGLTLVGALTLAAASTVSQTEKAAAIDLNFSTSSGTIPFTDIDGSPGFRGSVISYTSVAPGVDALIGGTAAVRMRKKLKASNKA
ncbi:hypothetical protein [Chamaesiphon polymorphus]|uniref:PEP-CTERM sorting domain-containing protein n=1 Tax=Chamaesiphon polymorphus CCALA 037 TaxID=2107692 RepID=A0A2T1GIX9_9CYAN|nr:hypothetical protein [Chamaesiphon polymorphus]PSB57711.1 hypothetical protein C7B77_07445 [Chamaesiphon polymorphus CCALA 037]